MTCRGSAALPDEPCWGPAQAAEAAISTIEPRASDDNVVLACIIYLLVLCM
jgi:hypothetical protein